MSLIRRAAAIASLGGVLLSTASALAVPPPAVFKTSAGEIVMHSGLTAGQQVSVEYPNMPAKRKIKADYCGLVTVPNSTTQPIGSTITVDGTFIYPASLPTQSKPSCTNNTLAESRLTNFKTADGSVVVVSKTPGISYNVLFDGANTTRQVRANSCGFLTLKSTTALPIDDSIKLNGTLYYLSNLQTDSMPLCRTADNSSVRYNPATW